MQSFVNDLLLKQFLAGYGFYDGQQDLSQAVKDYQEFHHLKPDGIAGPVTSRHLTMPRFCGLPDRMESRGQVAKYPAGVEVTYANAHAVPGFSMTDTEDITDLAIREWNTTSGLKAKRAANAKTATIVLTVGQIDGRSGTLAWSELAKLPQTIQRYDNQEPWRRGEGWEAAQYPYIDLLLVMLHELGHAFGLEHAPGQSNLLSPIYSPNNVRPGQWEIAEMRKRYGDPQPDQVPEPGEPSPVEEFLVGEMRRNGVPGALVWRPL